MPGGLKTGRDAARYAVRQAGSQRQTSLNLRSYRPPASSRRGALLAGSLKKLNNKIH